MTTAVVVGFAGAIGSGKTAIASVVASALGCRRASFGDYVREQACLTGLDSSSRETLQEIGERLIADGWVGFCEKVLAYAGWEQGQSLSIDGVRHMEAVKALRALVAPTLFYLIFLDVTEDTRRERLYARGLAPDQNERTDAHPMEVEARSVLPVIADYRVQTDRSTDKIAADILAWIEQNRLGST